VSPGFSIRLRTSMDRLVPSMELAQGFDFVAAPHAGGDNAGHTALWPDRIAEAIESRHTALSPQFFGGGRLAIDHTVTWACLAPSDLTQVMTSTAFIA